MKKYKAKEIFLEKGVTTKIPPCSFPFIHMWRESKLLDLSYTPLFKDEVAKCKHCLRCHVIVIRYEKVEKGKKHPGMP